ncbi:MAG: acyl carrier protein [Candidatus Geothermincolia bacterium]
MNQLKTELRQYIIENFLFGQDNSVLTDDVSFLEQGLIDSTGVLEIVAHLEQTYGVSVEDEELIPLNFDSVNNLAAYVSRKTGRQGD